MHSDSNAAPGVYPPNAPGDIYLPARQSVHVAEDDALSVVEYLPTTQLVHSPDPVVEYFPAAQSVQTSDPIMQTGAHIS